MPENFLTGFDQAPNSLPWTSLLILYLSNNKLQEPLPIPPPSTVYYKVHSNMLSGEITQMICNLSFLSYLDLSYNNLSGYLPQCLGNLSNLSILNLRHNNFHGHIPQMFIEGCQLSMINLNQNYFQGVLPRSLVNCTMLEILDIGNNHISDIFPSWLGILPELGVLILRSNGFHGAIGKPETNSTFPKLHVIDLSNNYITGKLPYEYFQIWKSMQSFDIGHLMYMQANIQMQKYPSNDWLMPSYAYSMTLTNKGIKTEYSRIQDFFVAIDLLGNKFEREIPKIWRNLKALHMLNLSNNILTSFISSSLATLTNLESLDLSQNMLVGEIPPQLVELTFLTFLNVAHNNFTGPIPQGKQFLTFQNNSFDGNVELCGSPLSKRCDNSEHPPTQLLILKQNKAQSFHLSLTGR
ncbi:receptor like protein 22-like [Quercus robur]|uniref:receptor like protein 22-like n=1 Tax=Quercus robur TaxID=38942 RepID=UPI002162F278|nr:receptor like protein 22-like [Quercus robur]